MTTTRGIGGAKIGSLDPRTRLGPSDETIGVVDQGEGGEDAWLVKLENSDTDELLRFIAYDVHLLLLLRLKELE